MSKPIDVVLIGGGIMSATLGTLLQRLEPGWSIEIFESLGDIAQESSNPWNNAGTGHSALCELNYTPEKNGQIDVSKAIEVNEQFQVSRQFWSYLVDEGALPDPKAFINEVPHMSFVWGEKNVDYLRRRYEALKDHPLFAGMEFSEDARTIRSWTPLLIPGRAKSEPIAATRIAAGTDVDFGALTRALIGAMTERGAKLKTDHRVVGLKRTKDGLWKIRIRHEVGGTHLEVTARFVFVGAGGGALNLLQKSRIPEIKGYGGFPISGEFLRTDNPEVVAKHQAKVYGKASVGAPPMSVPHLDTRVVNGQASLLFGPYAGFSTKYLKKGSLLDLFQALRPHNLGTFIGAGLGNLDLVKYLVTEVFATRAKKMRALREFAPTAVDADWRLITAGQRVQVMKKGADGKAVIQFGTEVVSAADGSIAGLLGASPGASTAVPIMLTLAEKCFPDKIAEWTPKLTEMVPSFGGTVGDTAATAKKTLARTAKALQIQA
ncbi:malate:quinone oxidoreductase [Schumannella sp. 10F1B-5-1]|uniref:malate:quinone oxidoreductase n=1 Tax=Schumannella sp. 10F1B-5-1 TaxID=2590780 RepID=UPI001130297E|nr:malate:quinone oxidoreductase [Schumannella sp. 10F1B-5-1]TPW73464.1 malate:quinone oxidoreductase [Schumannella sp. 10F1B-5-1]